MTVDDPSVPAGEVRGFCSTFELLMHDYQSHFLSLPYHLLFKIINIIIIIVCLVILGLFPKNVCTCTRLYHVIFVID